MDIETLANHICNLGRKDFELAARIVLIDIFKRNAISVDGQFDGGTDFASYNADGERERVAYQITTQRTAIKDKAYKDAKKSIEKLKAKRFYFFTTRKVTEVDKVQLEDKISQELNIATTVFDASIIAGLLINEKYVGKFLEETCTFPSNENTIDRLDYREIALHSYTIFSDDSVVMKEKVYDDSILFVLNEHDKLTREALTEKVMTFLQLRDCRRNNIERRIDALFSKSRIKKHGDLIRLPEEEADSLDNRKTLYLQELQNLATTQMDLMRNEYHIEWNLEDSKRVAVWIAHAFIADQFAMLKEMSATIINNPLFSIEENGIENLRAYLTEKISKDTVSVDEILKKLLQGAVNNPLITKLSRASIYLVLEGATPISSVKALGAKAWSEFSVMIEPTVAIPYICSQFYAGHVNRFFDTSVKSVHQALEFNCKLYIPYFYINECAGHLLLARKFDGIQNLKADEMQFSSNAFVSNYFALKKQGIRMPDTFIDYLCTFSPSIITEHPDQKEWIRSIMTDLQSLLTRSGIYLCETPFYKEGDCQTFETSYEFHLNEKGIRKPKHLINHDVWALQFTNDEVIKKFNKWIILSYDSAMTTVSRIKEYKALVCSPNRFVDLTELSRPLSDMQQISILHKLASYSDRTLAVGARIIDKVVEYASDLMQNWEFNRDIELFKENLINETINENEIYWQDIDKKTIEFIKKHKELNSLQDDSQLSEEDLSPRLIEM